MIVSRCTSFNENFVIRSYEVTEMFHSGRDSTNVPSARIPRNLGSQEDFVLREVSEDTVFTQIHFCLRLRR